MAVNNLNDACRVTKFKGMYLAAFAWAHTLTKR